MSSLSLYYNILRSLIDTIRPILYRSSSYRWPFKMGRFVFSQPNSPAMVGFLAIVLDILIVQAPQFCLMF